MKQKETCILGSFLSNAILGTEMSRKLWRQEGNDIITLLKSVIADEFLNKQLYIVTIRTQHFIWPVEISLSDISLEKSLCIAGGSTLKYLKKPISDST